jgi:hypothetical protein
MDEGISLYGAKRILLGQIPYKDFFDICVTPGTDYLLAGIFKVFGTTLKVARITTIIANALNVAMLYLISISFIKNKIALIPSLLLMIIYALVLDYYPVSHHWFAITAGIFTLLLSLKSEEGKINWIFPGLGAFLTFIFIQSVGLAICGMIVLFLLIKLWLSKDKRNNVLHDFVYYSLGFWIPIVSVLLFFYANGGLRDFIFDVFFWPWHHYKLTNNVSYFTLPVTDLLRVLHYHPFQVITYIIMWYFPPLLLCSGFIVVFKKYSKDKIINYHSILPLVIMAGFFISELFSPNIQRFVIYFALFFMVILSLWSGGKGLLHSFFRIVGVLYIVGGLAFIGYFCGKEFLLMNFVGKNSVKVSSPVGNLLVYGDNPPGVVPNNILGLLNAMNWKFPKNTFIFYWSPMLYFISGTNNPTMLNIYVPLYNTKSQVAKVIQQLASSKPKLIIMDNYLNILKSSPDRNTYPEVFDPANDKILQYVETHYVPDKKLYGVYTIYRLKNKSLLIYGK